MRKLLTALALFTVFATPSLAQSFCTCDGTGNVLTFNHNRITLSSQEIATGHSAAHSFAMVPGARSVSSSNSPEATGGGSLGYNEMLRNF
jgi:hypothetical protein